MLILRLVLFNVNCFLPHQQSIQQDNLISHSHIACFVETWLRPRDCLPIYDDHNHLCNDSQDLSRGRNGGLLTYVHHHLRIVMHHTNPHVSLEHQIFIVSPKELPHMRVAFLLIYHNPSSKNEHFLQQLDILLGFMPESCPCLVMGDFNIDSSTKSTPSKKLSQLLRYYGYIPIVQNPTHHKEG